MFHVDTYRIQIFELLNFVTNQFVTQIQTGMLFIRDGHMFACGMKYEHLQQAFHGLENEYGLRTVFGLEVANNKAWWK